MSGLPFLIHPWHEAFLPRLRDLTLDATNGNPGNAVIVFPHDRPKRYITRLFSPKERGSANPRPLILPRMLTVRELFGLLTPFDANLPREAGLLDKIALLWDVTRDAGQEASALGTALAAMDEASFFPWGTRLAGILEECFSNALAPEDIQHAEGEVAPFAAALLGSLKTLFARYREALQNHALTTPGLTAFQVCEGMDSWTALPLPLAGKTVFLAGFSALNGTEEKLFRRLWEEGARVCLHGDPALAAQGTPVHYACAHLARWIRRWNAPCEALAAQPAPEREVRFFAGHDLHSQLSTLKTDLAQLELPADGGVAVALTHADALLPVLHHLPVADCNVSLGYPLAVTPLARLIDAILDLADSRTKDGRVHWSRLAELVRQPCLRMLSSAEGPLRGVLLAMERGLREGQRNVLPERVAKEALFQAEAGPETEKLLARVLENTFGTWSHAETPEALADCLSRISRMLLDDGAEIWPRFPLDAEGLYRLMHKVIPALKNSVMARRALPWALLASILRELLKNERVPFEADPLTGVQILGMLETRLIHLEHVFLLDVTEDRLPGVEAPNPLLPDSLRGLLGLPDTEHRDQLAAYTFHSLIAGARSVNCYWQEGMEAGALFDGRKQRSRFVEKLIWDEERRTRRLLCKGEAPFFVPAPRLRRPTLVRREIAYTKAIRDALDAYLRRPLSPTALDAYLRCPAKFFYERLGGIAPLKTVQEEDDAPGVGILLHNVLCEFYRPWLNRKVHRNELSPDDLADLFETRLAASGLEEALPPESAAMLRVAGPERLRRYIANQPDVTCPLALETKFEASLDVAGRRLKLGGCLDRADRRDGGVLILDYKTGYVSELRPKFWESALHDDIRSALDDAALLFDPDPENDLLHKLAEALPSVQLPAYLYLYRENTGEGDNAAYVELGRYGEEKALFPPNFPDDLRENAIETLIPNLLRFVAARLLRDSAFRPREGRHCNFCTALPFCAKPNTDPAFPLTPSGGPL